MNKNTERLYNGIIKENPTFVLMLGMCPTLAVTTAAVNGLGMGLSTTVVLVLSNLLISLFRKVILVVPLMVLLPRLWGLGAYGVFASEPVSDILGGAACYITMMCTVWRDMKRPDET